MKSPSFNAKNVGLWKQYFEDPKPELKKVDELKIRMKNLLQRAFRAPVDDKTFIKYFSFANQQMERGLAMGQAMKEVLSAILASPRFLYIYDRSGEESTEPKLAQNLDLASRLSFFYGEVYPMRNFYNEQGRDPHRK